MMSLMNGFCFTATKDQTTVNVRFTSESRELFLIEGETYTLSLDCVNPRFSSFKIAGTELLFGDGIVPTINGKKLIGPGRINIYSFGTQMYEIHLRDLKHPDVKGDLELCLYAYGKRVFIKTNLHPRGNKLPATEIAWEGTILHPMALPLSVADPDSIIEQEKLAVAFDPNNRIDGGKFEGGEPAVSGEFRSFEKHPANFPDPRSASLALFSATTPESLAHLLRVEKAAEEVQFKVTGGIYNGYQKDRGYHDITILFRWPWDFETAYANPNQRFELGIDASLPSQTKLSHPAEYICNVRNVHGTLEGAVLTDDHGFPLPVQVQVCKNFAGEFEEGQEEGDTPYGESYFPITLKAGESFKGRCYHLFGNWGTHPLKQISSIRFFHHYFHASLGPTETFCYVPFEFPMDEGRNYLLADVRGQSNFMWDDQPQHEHVSVIGILKYKSGGRWINNVLQDTRIHLTSPCMGNFSLDYLSADGKVKTTVEIMEIPQADEARCYMKMKSEVLDTVSIDESTARNFRILNAGAYIVHTVWPHLAYTSETSEIRTIDIPNSGQWMLEGVPMGKERPFVAGYSHKYGNMCFYVHKFEGVLGGKTIQSPGLSAYGAPEWTEFFLTAPGALTQLEKGDHFEAHLIVMPYGNADVDYRPAAKQREIFSPEFYEVEVSHGKRLEGFPGRIKADSRGFAEFTLANGHDWTPILVEGFSSYKAPLLWEMRNGSWFLHDQQIYGNDWYQSYQAEDGSYGFVFVVNSRKGRKHHFMVSVVPNAESITQKNGYVTIQGGPMDFISPVPFKGLTCQQLEGTNLLHCSGKANEVTVE